MPRNPLKKVYGEWEPPRTEEAEAYTYMMPSGKARVIYYPLLGETKITSTYGREHLREAWDLQNNQSILLTPEDTLTLGAYLAGLQPHIREVLARKEQASLEQPVQELPEDAQEDSQPDQDAS